MRLTEALTIYLAIGASFGVARLFNARSAFRARVLLKAIGSALAWPVAALRLGRDLARDSDKATVRTETALDVAQRRARRAFEEALCQVEETASVSENSVARNDFERSVRELLSAIDQHFHLRSALQAMSIDAAPLPLASELCRLSGRTGNDLQIAAACLHRQNKARLDTHCAKSSDELIVALERLRTMADEHAPSAPAQLAHRQNMLTLYCLTIELVSQLDDAATAVRIGRLVDDECAKLRRAEQRGGQANENDSEVSKISAPANHSTLAPVP